MSDFIATYVSQKISKIRWKLGQNKHIHQCEKPEFFATGSWDNESNKVCMWSLQRDNVKEQDDPIPHVQGEPQLLSSSIHAGHVTDLQFLDGESFAAASSLGNVTLYKQTPRQLLQLRQWKKLHQHKTAVSPCTGIATKGEDTLVTTGEDGRINVLNADQTDPIRTIEKADSCTIKAVTFLKQFEIATVNSTGQLKVWDLREGSQQPSRIFLMSGDCVGLQCLDKHPAQQHIVATGGQDGTLCIWDMRQDRFPVTLLSAHSAQIWEIKFHPSHPDNLFTCSEDGTLWHWDGSSINAANQPLNAAKGTHGAHNTSASVSMSLTNHMLGKPAESFTSSWLASDATKHRLEITDLLPGNTMPVNTLDVAGNSLICGTDGEQIYTMNNLTIS